MGGLSKLLNIKSRARSNEKPLSEPEIPSGPSPISSLPYEVLENILVFAWHGDPTGLPANGTFVLEMKNPVQDASSDASGSVLRIEDLLSLIPNIHTKLSTSAEAPKVPATKFYARETFVTLSLVCSTWHSIMREVTLTHVCLDSLAAFRAYARLIAVELPGSDLIAKLAAKKAEPANEGSPVPTNDTTLVPTEHGLKCRRLCRSLVVSIPTGNLTIVPSWDDIQPIIQPLSSLTHLMLTASEPHPALLALLANLPSTIRTLDIHTSSPYVFTQGSIRKQDIAALRAGVANVKHLLLNALDSRFLFSILEAFGSAPKEKQARNSKTMYSSTSLQTLTILGPHDLNEEWFTTTVAHSSTLHTLKIYPRTNRTPLSDPFIPWHLSDSLQNDYWLPRLEAVVVQLPLFEESTPELGHIRGVCERRNVRLVVETAPRFGYTL